MPQTMCVVKILRGLSCVCIDKLPSATLAEWLSGWGENLRHCALNQKNMCKHVGSIVGDGSCLLHFAERLRVWQRTVASVFNGVSRSARAPV